MKLVQELSILALVGLVLPLSVTARTTKRACRNKRFCSSQQIVLKKRPMLWGYRQCRIQNAHNNHAHAYAARTIQHMHGCRQRAHVHIIRNMAHSKRPHSKQIAATVAHARTRRNILSNIKQAPKPQQHIVISKRALTFTNQFRVQQRLPNLQWHDQLANIATAHSKAMAEKKVPFGHAGFNARVNTLNPRAWACAENVYMCYNMPGDVAQLAVDGWIDSPGHLRNLVGDYTHCGIGTYQNVKGEWYITQIFARF